MKESKSQICFTITKNVDCRFLLSLPTDYDESIKSGFPLLLFLHGSGERGSNLNHVKKVGIPLLIKKGKEFPFIIVSPQCPANERWSPDILNSLLDHLVDELNVDKSRIYVTGLSMGGQGTWEMGNQYSERFAAIAPICGFFVMLDVKRFKNLPVWCFHGAMDNVVPVTDSINMIKGLKNAGCKPLLTIYPDADHDSWTETYNNPKFFKWLLSQKKKKKD